MRDRRKRHGKWWRTFSPGARASRSRLEKEIAALHPAAMAARFAGHRAVETEEWRGDDGKLLEWKDSAVTVKSAIFGEGKFNGEIDFILNEAIKKTANASLQDPKRQALPEIIFMQDNINLDAAPATWNVGRDLFSRA